MFAISLAIKRTRETPKQNTNAFGVKGGGLKTTVQFEKIKSATD
jgi:hypothetical protein